MDNFKCLVDHACKILNKEDTYFYVDFIDVCENVCTELSKSLKVLRNSRKSKNLQNMKKKKKKKELIFRLDELNKKNEIFRKQVPLKMKS